MAAVFVDISSLNWPLCFARSTQSLSRDCVPIEVVSITSLVLGPSSFRHQRIFCNKQPWGRSIFWRSWNLRLFLVHHKKWFLHLRSLQQSSCIYRASPKNISWNLWCREHLFWKVNNNILESYWTYRFPTLYQTTILGTRWDLEDTRVINIKSCQANYLPISTMPLINQMIAWISNGNFCFFHGSLGNSAKVLS